MNRSVSQEISYLTIQENICFRVSDRFEMQAIALSGKIDTILDHPHELVRSIFQFPLGSVPTIMRAHIRLTWKPRLETFCPQGGEVAVFLGSSGRARRTRVLSLARTHSSGSVRSLPRVTSNIREKEHALFGTTVLRLPEDPIIRLSTCTQVCEYNCFTVPIHFVRIIVIRNSVNALRNGEIDREYGRRSGSMSHTNSRNLCENSYPITDNYIESLSHLQFP